MTVVVGYASPEGIVLASDSRTMITRVDNGGTERHRIASDHTQKVFSISDYAVVATHGWAYIGPSSISTLMDEFEAQVASGDERPPAADLPKLLGDFFHERCIDYLDEINEPWSDGDDPLIGFLVAYYDDDGVGRLAEVLAPGPSQGEEVNTESTGLVARGQSEIIVRLIAGVAWEQLDEAINAGLKLDDEAVEALSGCEFRLVLPAALQDAVDMVTLLIRTTIDMHRFVDGPIAADDGLVPACGGPVRVVALTRTGVQHVTEHHLTAVPESARRRGV